MSNPLAELMGEAVEDLEREHAGGVTAVGAAAMRPSTADGSATRAPLGGGAPASGGEDDEIEVERFGGKKAVPLNVRLQQQGVSAGGGSAPRPSTAPAKSTAAPAAPFTSYQSSFSVPTAEETSKADKAAASAAAAAAAAPDEFGIVYKKKTLPQKSAVPSGPAFQDEQLFEREVQHSQVLRDVEHSAAAADDDDDEFDFDVDAPAPARRGLSQSAQQREAERKALERKAEEEAKRAMEEMKAEAARIAGVKLPEATAKDKAKADKDKGKTKTKGRKPDTAADAPNLTMLREAGPLHALTEGDEDEEEEEEEEDDGEEPDMEAFGDDAFGVDVQDGTAAGGASEGVGGGAFGASAGAGSPEDAVSSLAAEFDQATEILQQRAAAAVEAGPAPGGAPASSRIKLLRYADAESHFFNDLPLQRYLPQITRVAPDPDAGCCASFFKTKLAPERELERDNLLCVAKMQYDSTDEVQYRLMATIFKRLTGVEFVGTQSSWEVIGFQRTDFTTDLRGGGMLGPLQMLYFAEKHPNFIRELYRVSQSDTQHFPLMCQSIQITARSMQALRQGKLNGVANASSGTAVAFHSFYMAMLFEFYDQWVSTGATIARMHYVMEDVQSRCFKSPPAVIARFEAAMKNPRFTGDATVSPGAGQVEFA